MGRRASGRQRRADRDPPESREKFSRRDVIAALAGGMVGVAGTLASSVIQDRIGPTLASRDLIVVPEMLWTVGQGWNFSAPSASKSLAHLGPFEYQADALDAVVARGLVRESPLVIKLNIARPGNSPAVVTRIKIANRAPLRTTEVLSYGTPDIGAHNAATSAGVGDGETITAHLDAPNPLFFLPATRDAGEVEDVFATKTMTIQPHLTESITLQFTAEGWWTFGLEVAFDIEGVSYAKQVDQVGQPFYIAPRYSGDKNRFDLEPDRDAKRESVPYTFRARPE